MKESLIDYNDIFFEVQTLKMELEGMSDSKLMEECNYILTGVSEGVSLDNLFVSYFKKGQLTSEERRDAEQFYTLSYISMGYYI